MGICWMRALGWTMEKYFFYNNISHVLSRTYPVEGGSLIPAVAAVEENVSCSFQKLEDESSVSGS